MVYGNVSVGSRFSDESTIVLCGNRKQTISRIIASNLEISNTSAEGVEFTGSAIATGHVFSSTPSIINGERLCISNGTILPCEYNGSVTFENSLTIQNGTSISGNVISVTDSTGSLTIPAESNVCIGGLMASSSTGKAKSINMQTGSSLTVVGDVSLSGHKTYNHAPVYFNNAGTVEIQGDFISDNDVRLNQSNSDALFVVKGDINQSGGIDGRITAGTLVVYGNVKLGSRTSTNTNVTLCGNLDQSIIGPRSLGVLEINKSTGMATFGNEISVSVLFDHHQNEFVLYNNGVGSTFVDYDGDGIKDNVDPYPTVGNPCTITIISEDEEKGTVSDDVISTVGGTKITVLATPTFKYCFKKWVNGSGTTVSTSAEYSFVAKADTTLIAIFAKRSQPITAIATGGTIIAPSSAEIESVVSVTIVEDEGYVFEEGSLCYNGTPIINGTFEMPDEPVELTAIFTRNEHYFALKQAISNAKAITYELYSADSFAALQDTIATAEAALINHITAVDSTAHITALQAAINSLQLLPQYVLYSVSIANSIEHGSVTASSAVAHMNDTITLTVTPDDRYVLGSLTYVVEGEDPVAVPEIDGAYSFTMPGAEVTVHAEFITYFPGNSLSLEGDIGVNFYVDVQGVPQETAKVVFSWGNGNYAKIETLSSKTAEDGTGFFKLTADVVVAQMTDVITATLYDGETEIMSVNYSVAQYARQVCGMTVEEIAATCGLSEEKAEKLQALCRAMLIYGAKAQAQFNYRTDDPADAGLDYTLADVGELGSTVFPESFEEATGLHYYGSSLLLESQTAYRLYFTVADAEKADALTVSLGETGLTRGTRGSYVYYEISDIPAAQVLDNISLTFGEQEVTANPGEYIRKALASGDDTLKATVKALYAYSTAAKEYFTN